MHTETRCLAIHSERFELHDKIRQPPKYVTQEINFVRNVDGTFFLPPLDR